MQTKLCFLLPPPREKWDATTPTHTTADMSISTNKSLIARRAGRSLCLIVIADVVYSEGLECKIDYVLYGAGAGDLFIFILVLYFRSETLPRCDGKPGKNWNYRPEGLTPFRPEVQLTVVHRWKNEKQTRLKSKWNRQEIKPLNKLKEIY